MGKHEAKYRNIFSSAWKLFAINARTFISFELLYVAFGALILLPIIMGLSALAMNVIGIEYIAPHNLILVLTSPVMWVWALFSLGLIAFYVILDICSCILICECSESGAVTGLVSIIKAAFKKAIAIFKPKNLPFLILALIVIPLTNLAIAPSFIGEISIPDFIITYIEYYRFLSIAFVILILALVVFAVLTIYSFHYYVLKGTSFVESVKLSAKLATKQRVYDLFLCLITQLVYLVVLVIAVLLLGAIVVGVGSLFQNSTGTTQIIEIGVSAAVLVVVTILFLIISTCSTPVCYVIVSALFSRHEHTVKVSDSIDLNALRYQPKKYKMVGNVFVACIAYLLSIVVVTQYYHGNLDIKNDEGYQSVEIVAHRCGANYAPENTVAALYKAASMGATWCEIDVQQLADGAIIVSHDSNLKRVAGFDYNTWEVTYDQVSKLDAGSFFSEEYAGEQIPLLTDMIYAAQQAGIKLQIEVKPTGYDEGIEQRVVDIVRECNFQNDCVIASQNFDCLQKIRACGDDFQVLFITSLAYGNISSMPEANSYSVESTWTTRTLCNNVHQQEGALIAAWTVNSENIMDKCIEHGVDQLVTDDIIAAQKVIAEQEEVENVLIWLTNLFSRNQ